MESLRETGSSTDWSCFRHCLWLIRSKALRGRRRLNHETTEPKTPNAGPLARFMRTLLAEARPPQPADAAQKPRISSDDPVFSSLDNLTEVGVAGTAIVTPGALT